MSQRPLTRGRYYFFPLGFHGPARTHVWTPGSRPGDWEPLSQTPRPHLLQRSPRPSLTLLRYPPTRTPPEAPSGSPLCIVLSLETSLPLPCSSFCREPSSAAPRPQPEGAEERGPPPGQLFPLVPTWVAVLGMLHATSAYLSPVFGGSATPDPP